MTQPVTNRYEFVLLFDVKNGNPNGDPDAGNMPRTDPETGHGIVTDVCLKRKIRDYIDVSTGERLYVTRGATLTNLHKEAWKAVKPEASAEEMKKPPKDQDKARELTSWMCANFWDIRTFGAVMNQRIDAGQVRGPVQLAFARSIDPITVQDIAITRMAETNEDTGGQTMGGKFIVPYGLYRVHGFVSAPLASHPTKGTGFSEEDLENLWNALINMFEHDRTAARGEMTSRKLITFRHDSALGNARATDLFDRVQVTRVGDVNAPARAWSDYQVEVDAQDLPQGVTLIEML